jgi:predicted small lipoprotein YifL
MKPAIPILIAAALFTLAGCGKEAPASTLPPIDSVFTRTPASSTKLELGRQQQDREDGDTDTTDTARVGGPTNESKGFRKD